MKNEIHNKTEEKWMQLIFVFILILLIWIGSLLFLLFLFQNWDERAKFSDSFGMINSLFSGLAFGGIIYTILLQRKELSLQRQELILTRIELERTANAQESSNNFQSEQLRVSNIPFYYYDAKFINGKDYLIINNESGKISFDIDLWIFILIFEEENSREDFAKNNVEEAYRNFLEKPLVDDEIWAIGDRGVYPYFPNDNQIIIPLNYPFKNSDFEIYIQYRDSLNNNYSQKVYFHKGKNRTEQYKANNFEPAVLTTRPRIDLTDFEQKSNFTDYEQWIWNVKQSAIFYSQIKNSFFSGVESRWKMEKTIK